MLKKEYLLSHSPMLCSLLCHLSFIPYYMLSTNQINLYNGTFFFAGIYSLSMSQNNEGWDGQTVTTVILVGCRVQLPYFPLDCHSSLHTARHNQFLHNSSHFRLCSTHGLHGSPLKWPQVNWFKIFTYCADIVCGRSHLLCSKQCQHNVEEPRTNTYNFISVVCIHPGLPKQALNLFLSCQVQPNVVWVHHINRSKNDISRMLRLRSETWRLSTIHCFVQITNENHVSLGKTC